MVSLLAVPSSHVRVKILPLSLPEINEKQSAQCLFTTAYISFISQRQMPQILPKVKSKKNRPFYTSGIRIVKQQQNRLSLFPGEGRETPCSTAETNCSCMLFFSPVSPAYISCFCKTDQLQWMRQKCSLIGLPSYSICVLHRVEGESYSSQNSALGWSLQCKLGLLD